MLRKSRWGREEGIEGGNVRERECERVSVCERVSKWASKGEGVNDIAGEWVGGGHKDALVSVEEKVGKRGMQYTE